MRLITTTGGWFIFRASTDQALADYNIAIKLNPHLASAITELITTPLVDNGSDHADYDKALDLNLAMYGRGSTGVLHCVTSKVRPGD